MTIKTILIVSLIAAVILPFSVMGMVDADSKSEPTKQDFKDDIKEWLKDPDLDKKSADQKSTELKTTYDKFFRESIEQIRVSSNTRDLSEEEILALKEYIVHETIKDEEIKAIRRDHGSSTLHVDFLKMFGIQIAEASQCRPSPTPNFKQVTLDINGGSYNGHNYNGDNDLMYVESMHNSRDCVTTFVLTFDDEDHPYLDTAYDYARTWLYSRTQDVEMFRISDSGYITFPNTWSSTNEYDYLFLGVGYHGTTIKQYHPTDTVYVSNTWNHMMDTSDTNRNLQKVSVP